MKKKKKSFLTKKQKAIIIIFSIILLILFILALIPLSNKKTQTKPIDKEDLNRELTTIQEVIEYLESTYIKEEKSVETGYDLDIYVSFKYDLYENNKSNETYFKNLYEKVAIVSEFKSFRLIDEEKDITIALKCNGSKISQVLINGQTEYFKKQDSQNSKENELKINTLNLKINSEVLQNLINANWETSRVNLGTQESSFYKYQIYFDEGYEVRTIQGKLYNIVFTKKYNGSVVGDYKVGDSLEKIEAEFGTSYKDTGIIGYKTKDFYVFFSTKEISIYPNNQYDYTEFENLVKEYNENKDINDFLYKITDIWPDYTTYNYATHYVELEYVPKGVRIYFSSYNKEGIQLYENYKGELKNSQEEYLDVYYKLNKNLMLENEKNRIMKTTAYDPSLSEQYPLLYSKNFYVTNEIDGDLYTKFKIVSLNEDYPNNELDETIRIYKYVWADDNHLIYSVQEDGIYLYNAQTRETEKLISGENKFEITDYDREKNILTYDGNEVIINY